MPIIFSPRSNPGNSKSTPLPLGSALYLDQGCALHQVLVAGKVSLDGVLHGWIGAENRGIACHCEPVWETVTLFTPRLSIPVLLPMSPSPPRTTIIQILAQVQSNLCLPRSLLCELARCISGGSGRYPLFFKHHQSQKPWSKRFIMTPLQKGKPFTFGRNGFSTSKPSYSFIAESNQAASSL